MSMTDQELAGLYPDIDGLERREPKAGDRVTYRARTGEDIAAGAQGTVAIVTGGGRVTVDLDSGIRVSASAQKFSPRTDSRGRIFWRAPQWLRDRVNDPCGTPRGHSFWDGLNVREVGVWRLFDRDGMTHACDTQHNAWAHFAAPDEAAQYVVNHARGSDIWA